jgi:RNA polymerase sigma-70 factor, ECF subfamily
MGGGGHSTDSSDESLLSAFRAGDAQAFDALCLRYRSKLLKRCVSVVGDRHLAEDLVQETFLRAYTRIDSFDSSRPFWPWLVTIAERLCFNALRDRRARPEALTASPADSLDRDAYGDGTFDEVARRHDRRSALEALGSLPRAQKRALALNALAGLSYQEIAHEERISVSSIKSLIFRARDSLRAEFAARSSGYWAGAVALRRNLRAFAREARYVSARWSTQRVGEPVVHLVPALVALMVVVANFQVTNQSTSFPSSLRARFSIQRHASVGNTHATLAAARRGAAQVIGGSGNWRQLEMDDTRHLVGFRCLHAEDCTKITRFTTVPSGDNQWSIFATGWNRECPGPGCGRILRSDDEGTRWRQLGTRAFGDDLVVAPKYPGDRRLYLMGPVGLQESLDDGASFHLVSPAVGPITSIHRGSSWRIVVGSAIPVEYEPDTGMTWPLSTVANPIDPSGSYAVAEFDSATGPTVVFAAAGRTVDSDSRATISVCARSCTPAVGLPRIADRPELRIDPNVRVNGRIVAFSSSAAYISSDWGRSFREIPLPGIGNMVAISDISLPAGPRWPGGTVILSVSWKIWSGLEESFYPSSQVFLSHDWGGRWTPARALSAGWWGDDIYGAMAVVGTPSGRVLQGVYSTGVACEPRERAIWFRRCAP